jgi:hemolysin activation/secretion protein
MEWRLRIRSALRVSACAFAMVAAHAASAQDAPAAAESAEPGPAPEQEDLKFDVMEYVVRGNSVLKPAEIQNALTPHTGYGKRVPDVMSARKALEDLYRGKGYQTVVVDVPQQDVSSGVIELAVSEGRIGSVRVTGADFVLPSEVRGSIPSLVKGSVPNVPELQRELSQANTRPTRSITPEFRAGVAPGTIDIDLVVDDKRPWGATVELSDQYNRSTERLRVAASAHYDNLWQAGHSANIAFQFAPQDFAQVQAISGSYYAPLGYSRTSLLAYVVNSNTDVATVGGLAVIGRGLTLGGRVMRTLGGSPAGVVQSLMFGVDYKDYLDQIGLISPTTGELLTFDTPVAYLPFTAQYRWINVTEDSTSEFTIGTTFAFDGLVGKQIQFGGRDKDPFDPGSTAVAGKRANSQASFLFVHGTGSYQKRFAGAFDAKFGLDWQIATDPLISNEQFVVGGLSSVRGYREAEILGDSGARGSLELGYKVPLGNDRINWRIAAFAEGGYAWVERPEPEEKSRFIIGSTGLTTSFDLFGVVAGQLDVAYRFDADPTDSGIPVDTDLGDLRVHFKIGVKY